MSLRGVVAEIARGDWHAGFTVAYGGVFIVAHEALNEINL